MKLRQKHHVNLVAISRTVRVEGADEKVHYEPAVITVPAADAVVLPEDTLILAGANDALAALPTD